MTPAERALLAARRLLGGEASWQRADLGLTLHLLEHLAPAFFAAQGLAPELSAALEALDRVPPEFPLTLDEDEAMARLDALYLRRVRGLKVRAFDAPGLAGWVARWAGAFPAHAWLMVELAKELGLALPGVLAERYPFRVLHPVTHLYMLTHEVMLDTRYHQRPSSLADGPRILDELEAALPGALAEGEWDLAAEIGFTLRAGGRPAPGVAEALARAQGPDGGMPVEGTAHEQAHAVATALIALAAL